MGWALIITIIALVGGVIMSAPTIFQMIWGKPNIWIELKCIPKNNGTVLCCLLCNYPISNSFLKTIGVYRRNAEDLLIFYEITDINNKQFALGHISEIVWGENILKKRIALPSSH